MAGISLRALYMLSGTDIAYGTVAISLRAHCALCGFEDMLTYSSLWLSGGGGGGGGGRGGDSGRKGGGKRGGRRRRRGARFN
eukprot:1615076-Rhodomonas_salina.1